MEVTLTSEFSPTRMFDKMNQVWCVFFFFLWGVLGGIWNLENLQDVMTEEIFDKMIHPKVEECTFYLLTTHHTLPETNGLPLEIHVWNTSFLLGKPIFRGYVGFREGTPGKLDQESSGWNVKMVEMGKSLSSAFMANSGYRPWKISTMVSALSEQRRTSRN